MANLITLAQLDQLPDQNGVRYELHHGELVARTLPKFGHSKLQHRLMLLLDARLRSFGAVTIEFGYRPLAEFEYRIGDVVAVSQQRWNAADPEVSLAGAPELVVEVRSPSNTRAQLRELASLCLANGCLEFWIVDQDNRSVTVAHQDGSTVVYRPAESIPLAAFGADSLPVARLFAA